MSEPSLSWRVPTTGDPRLLRIAVAQVGLASIVAALVLVVAMPGDWLVPGLLGLIPLAVFMAYFRWVAYRRTLVGSDNVRIDEAGVHWLDTTGQEHSFLRKEVIGFHIGRNADTLRRVPSLTLQLSGGLESQPIELHAPATEDVVRRLLVETWNIIEDDYAATANEAGDYDVAVSVYGECHDEFQEWHWEGTKDELCRLFAQFAVAADELPLPPPGVKPLTRTILLSRRQPTRLRLAHAPIAHFDADMIAAPAAVLRDIASRAPMTLAGTDQAGDTRLDVSVGPCDTWTFHLHVRSV
ncbi:MAG TPA: hypothetical protein VKH44_12800 [Pirellulaceae bacterium]|nr:hypothetical protein [Pirellulaceae bacterium]